MNNDTNNTSQTNTVTQDVVVSNKEQDTKQKIKLFSMDKIKQIYQKIDSKLEILIPNKLLRKILIITVVSFIVIFLLLFILGLIFSVSRPKDQGGFTLNKPNIIQSSPAPSEAKTKIQLLLVDLKNQVDDLKFPDSYLTQPTIETKITIDKKK